MTRISLKSAANKISIHAPPRGATRLRISIHAPPRGATAVSATMSRLRDFNSRPSARGDPHTRVSADLRSDFNSRPSARGDLRDALWRSAQEFQFTPLREGRQNLDWAYKSIKISIHAPPRGATARCSQLYCDVLISIHAPPRGATALGWGKKRWKTSFQFTPLREGRQYKTPTPRRRLRFQFTPLREGRRSQPLGLLSLLWISIHAPPRGATRSSGRTRWQSSYFNSRPSARGDSSCSMRISSPVLFQFTPLREGRRQKICNFCKSFVQPLQISMA